MKNLIVMILMLPVCRIALSQNMNDDHNHTGEEYHIHTWEAGLGVGAVFIPGEDNIAPGAHIHLMRSLPGLERLAIGPGVETVMDEHSHYNLAFGLTYAIYKGLSAGLAPGIEFAKEEDEWSNRFSMHFELAYGFPVGRFHIGPVAEYSFSGDEGHIMLGAHFGVGF